MDVRNFKFWTFGNDSLHLSRDWIMQMLQVFNAMRHTIDQTIIHGTSPIGNCCDLLSNLPFILQSIFIELALFLCIILFTDQIHLCFPHTC